MAVNVIDVKGRTALHYACAEGSADSVRTLLSYRKSVLLSYNNDYDKVYDKLKPIMVAAALILHMIIIDVISTALMIMGPHPFIGLLLLINLD